MLEYQYSKSSFRLVNALRFPSRRLDLTFDTESGDGLGGRFLE